MLAPSEVLRFPSPARPGDWVSCIGIEEDRALFMSTPNAELAGRVPVDLTVVDRATGGATPGHRFTFEPFERGHDWFAAIAFRAGVAITRRGHLVSLGDGEVRRTLPLGDGDGRSFWAFASDEQSFLAVRRDGGKWIYAVHESASGEERARTPGAAPMMVYVGDGLSEIVVVGAGRAFTARAWRTADAKMSRVSVSVKGEPIFTPDLKRWMVWERERGIVVGERGGEPRALGLPSGLADAGIRHRLGNESLILTVTLGEDLRVVAIDLASGRVRGELHLPGGAGPSAPPYLDRSGRWVLFVSRAGTCAWRLGSSEHVVVALPGEVGGAFTISGLNIVSNVAGAERSPWTSGGFYLANENALAFYELP